MKKVVIIGASGHGKVVADIVRANGDEVVGFLDDAYLKGTDFFNSKILGNTKEYCELEGCEFFIAIGNSSIRKVLSGLFDYKWYTAIHPSAQISPSAVIGKGTCVMANAVINADAQVGDFTIINTGAIVEHDCKIGDYCHLSPRATVCGVTTVGDNVWLGTGSTVKNVVSICDDVILGAGAVVVNNIKEPGTYIGVPAKLKNK